MHLWYTEYQTDNIGLSFKIKETLFVGRSKYQDIAVLDTFEFGRLLVLDGLVMTTERDEFIYHELITHPALFTHRCAKNVLVIGGGDGGSIREIIKHDNIKEAVLCEIDPIVVEVSKRYLPSLSSELENPKVKIVYKDGINFVSNFRSYFDIIIVDSTDPIGPAKGLFGLSFYRDCFAALKDEGILICQSESPIYHLDLIQEIQTNLKRVDFPIVKFYYGIIPTYPSGMWSWAFASKKFDPLRDIQEEKIKNRKFLTKYYNLGIHKAIFNLPSFFKKGLG